jgi:integrase
VLSLANARKEARRKLEEISGGGDPREARREAERAESETVAVVAERFVERYVKVKNKGWKQVEQRINHEILPRWGKRPIASITQRDVIALLDSIVDRGSPILANRVLAIMRKMFNWCCERGTLQTSPCDRVKAPSPEVKRDRVLTDSELALIWRAADTVGHPFGPYFQLLALTGQRREEVAGMRWSELDRELTMWTLPAARAKNNVQHQVPIVPWARSVLTSVPRIVGSEYVFTTTGRSSISGYSKAKASLDEAIITLNAGTSIPAWVVHDLRRTMATGMAKLGVALPTVEKLLNHIGSGSSFGGVSGVYQRHDFADEKRIALECWAQHLLTLDLGAPRVVTSPAKQRLAPPGSSRNGAT